MWPAGAGEPSGKGRIHARELRKVMVLHNHSEPGAAVIICTRLLEDQVFCHSHVKRNHQTLTPDSRHSIHPVIPWLLLIIPPQIHMCYITHKVEGS